MFSFLLLWGFLFPDRQQFIFTCLSFVKLQESKVAHWFAISAIYEIITMGYVADSIKYGVL